MNNAHTEAFDSNKSLGCMPRLQGDYAWISLSADSLIADVSEARHSACGFEYPLSRPWPKLVLCFCSTHIHIVKCQALVGWLFANDHICASGPVRVTTCGTSIMLCIGLPTYSQSLSVVACSPSNHRSHGSSDFRASQ